MWREPLKPLPFIPRKAWIRDVFACSAPRRELKASADPAGLIAASLLVPHASLHSHFPTAPDAVQIGVRRVELLQIARFLTLSWPQGLFLAAKLSGVNAPGFRRSNIRIRSESSALATQFHPPLPENLKAGCKELGVQLMAANGVLPPLERALIASMVFLTLHPFADGNGRTARHIFVSWILKNGYTDPAYLSAFAGCFFGNSLKLQLALKALRLGDASQLLELYATCYASVVVDLEPIHAQLPYGFVEGRPAVDALRQHLVSRML